MTQFARPISDSAQPDPYYDRSTPGSVYVWNREACDKILPLWDGIDDVTPNEETDHIKWYCATSSQGTAGVCAIKLSTVPDPGTDVGLQLVARFRSEFDYVNTRVICRLYQGEPPDSRPGSNNPSNGTLIAEIDTFLQPVSSDYTTWTHNLTEAEAALITDFSDLWLQLNGSIPDEELVPLDRVRITQAYLSVPDAGLTFSQQPTNVEPTVSILPAINIAGPEGAVVTLALGNNPGSAVLTGTLVRTVSGGTALFTGVALDKLGLGYTMVASSPGLSDKTSDPFDVRVATPCSWAIDSFDWRQVVLSWVNCSNIATQIEIERGDGPSPGSGYTVIATKSVPADNSYTDPIPLTIITIPPSIPPPHVCYRARFNQSTYGYSAYATAACQILTQAVGNKVAVTVEPSDREYHAEDDDPGAETYVAQTT